MAHYFDQPTISLARWTLGTCVVLIAISTFLAASGTFPGQQPARLILPVSDVVDYTYKVTSALIGKPGLIARVPINTNVYPDGIPHTLRLQVTLAPKLAEDCDLARHFDRFRQRVHSKGYEQEDGGAALIETRRSDVKGVQLFDLDREGDYRLDVYLVAKKTAAQPEIAKKLILDERRMTVIEDPLP